MKIPLSWLNEYVDLNDKSATEICETMTMLGLEIESVEETGAGIQNVVVGHIQSIEPHPDADKLSVCKTDIGEAEPVTIVCGATNMSVGDKVPTALIGGSLPGGFAIGKRKMRGIESQGMMCSARELGMGDDHAGLLILDSAMKVGSDVRGPLGLNETVLEIEITPNRNDWSGLIGIARELAAHYDRPLILPEAVLTESDEKAADVSSITIDTPELCNRYIGRIIKGVKIGPSPDWLKKRLIDAGQRPINNVVDVTNYVLLETGHPLHAFDLNKLSEHRIVVRTAKDGEVIKTIDQEERKLTSEMLVIADAKVPVAVAGIMGGYDSEVGDDTVDLLIESAYFSPTSIRKTSRTLNLVSEASQRFQRGSDIDMIPLAANRTCQLIQEVAGGSLLSGTLDEYPNVIRPQEISHNFNNVNARIGTDVPRETHTRILKSLGFNVSNETETEILVSAPPRRHDASRPADLVEEIARHYGFHNIPATLPKILPTDTVYAPNYKRLQHLRTQLTYMGLTEIYTWAFTSREDLQNANLTYELATAVPLENPLSEKNELMRPTLIPSVLHIASANIRKNTKNIRIFEMAPVYLQAANAEDTTQHDRLTICISGERRAGHWSQKATPCDVFDLKGYIEEVASLLESPDLVFKSEDHPAFAVGESATIFSKGNPIGHLGRLKTPVATKYAIDQDIFIAEIQIQALISKRSKVTRFTELSGHPVSMRDIAVVVDESVPAGDIQASASKAGGKILQNVDIFDIFTGNQVAPGKKSVALSLTFQSPERTLTDQDTEKAWNKILKTLQHSYNAELR